MSLRTFLSDISGPWIDTLYHTSGGEIVETISQEKWEKTQSLVLELARMVEKAVAIEDQESEAAKVS